MKIKIAYGVDMRLWKYDQSQEKPAPEMYTDLLTYIRKTFEFTDDKQYRVTFKDDDDEMTTISTFEDFQDAFISAKQQKKKSLKLHIVSKPQQQPNPNEEGKDDEKAEEAPIKSTIDDNFNNEAQESKKAPTAEEINAFLSDDLVIDLLSDLFISVFEALQASQFEIGFIECVQGVLLSDDGKYDKIMSNPVWPFFMDELLPKHSQKIETFVIPMIQMNGCINTEMIKQWIPTMLSMMKMHHQHHGVHGFPAWRGRGFHHHGRGGWRGRGFPHHHPAHFGPDHHHHHHGGRGRRGRRGFGYKPWFQHQHHHQQHHQDFEGATGHNNDEDQIEPEQFEYTEELVAIMNMGFSNMNEIKQLLIEHKGNKQNVVQELVLSKK